MHHEELLTKEWFVQADVSTLSRRLISLAHHNHSLSPMLDNRGLIVKMLKKAQTACPPPQGTLFQE